MVNKISPKNRIDEKFLNKLFSKDGCGCNDGIESRYSKALTEFPKYFDSIYYDWENVIHKKIKEKYKEHPEIQKIINQPNLTSSKKIDLIYAYIYNIEKVQFDKEYKDAYDYFEHFFTKKKFEELYKNYQTKPEIQAILNDTNIRSDHKNKLILIKIFQILVKDFEKDPSFEKLYLRLGNRIEDEFKLANDYFREKFKYSGSLDYSSYINNLLDKHRSDKVIKEIYSNKGLSDNTKLMLSIIYIKEILNTPGSQSIQELIKGSLNKLMPFSIYIPYLLKKEDLNEKLNEEYNNAQEYFMSKYSLNQPEKIDKLISRYKDHPNVEGIIDSKQLLVSLKQIDEEESKALSAMKKLITDYYSVISLNQLIEDNISRYLQQFEQLAHEKTFKYKGFNIYRFTLDPEVQKIIKAYIIYKGETDRIANEKKSTQKAKRDAEEAIEKAAKEEESKLYEENLDRAFKEAIRYFEITYPNTQYERNKRFSYLENTYFDQLVYTIANGIMVNNYLYKDLETNDEHLKKAKMIFLYTKDLEDNIIETNYKEAIKYFEKKYGNNFQDRINQLSTKYESSFKILDRYYDYYYFPNEELKSKYKIYKFYLYDDYGSFFDLWRKTKGFIDYYGTIFGYILDRLLLKWVYMAYDAYKYIVDMKWWYYPKYKRGSVGPSGPTETEKLLKANINALVALEGQNLRVNRILNNLSRRDQNFITASNNINQSLNILNRNFNQTQQQLRNIALTSDISSGAINNRLISITNSLDNINRKIVEIEEKASPNLLQLENLQKSLENLNTSIVGLIGDISRNSSPEYNNNVPSTPRNRTIPVRLFGSDVHSDSSFNSPPQVSRQTTDAFGSPIQIVEEISKSPILPRNEDNTGGFTFAS